MDMCRRRLAVLKVFNLPHKDSGCDIHYIDTYLIDTLHLILFTEKILIFSILPLSIFNIRNKDVLLLFTDFLDRKVKML